MDTKLRYAVMLWGLGMTLLCSGPVHTQEVYPSKPIQVVVTTAAGGALDLVARTVADRLSPSLHQPMIIENQPAGNGGVAAGQFVKAAPDGHTLMMVVDSMVTRLPLVLVSNPAVRAGNLQELIALIKAKPGQLNYASTGVGTQLHIGMEMFKLMTGTDIVHVPYRATTSAMTDLVGGRVDLALIGLSSAKTQVESGKLRAYAIAAPRRSSLMPNLPTAAEVALPGYEVRSWFGMLAPARTPTSIIDRLSREIRLASTDPKFMAALEPQGMEIIASSPEEMAKAMREDFNKWGKVIRETGTTINQ
jgi:tripartite-type tricarboxylate transporter receptor subunit TctC